VREKVDREAVVVQNHRHHAPQVRDKTLVRRHTPGFVSRPSVASLVVGNNGVPGFVQDTSKPAVPAAVIRVTVDREYN
jgi:hypothetical protein